MTPLTDVQKDQLTLRFKELLESLTRDQLMKLYFRLDDIIQYSPSVQHLFLKLTREGIEKAENKTAENKTTTDITDPALKRY